MKPFWKSHQKTSQQIIGLFILICIVSLSIYYVSISSSKQTLLLATTTSTANSGLLDEILPYFEKEHNVVVKILPVGTGQALELGKRGDVDILMVHDPGKEQEFVSYGYGTNRYQVCYNYFVLIGPPSDPANIQTSHDITDALTNIITSGSKFISRGDESGTHSKEQLLWALSGYDYSTDIDIPENKWYYSVSAGMGDTLMRANELEAYTLSDEGTYWAYDGSLQLTILLRDDPSLLNQYSIIPVNPERYPHVNYGLSMALVQWITSLKTQEKIGEFEKHGQQLFFPNAEINP